MRINEITLIQVNAGLEGRHHVCWTTDLVERHIQLPTATAPEVPTSHGVQPSIRFPPVYSGERTPLQTAAEATHTSACHTHTYTALISCCDHYSHHLPFAVCILSVLSLRSSSRCLHPSPHTYCLTTIPPYS